MAFIWRRRSTTIVKLVALMLAIWFCIAFLIYTDDTRRRAAQDTSGYGGAVPAAGDPIALALQNRLDSSGQELDAAEAVPDVVAVPAAAAAAGADLGQEADVPPTAKQHKSRVKVLPRQKVEDSRRQNADVQPEDKIINKPKDEGECNCNCNCHGSANS